MPRSTSITRTTLEIREAYLNQRLSLLVGWSVAASCRDSTCVPGDAISVGQLLSKGGDRYLKEVTARLRCRVCHAPAHRVCLRQPAAGGGYIEHVVVAPLPPGRND